jgi:hypothetical protein
MNCEEMTIDLKEDCASYLRITSINVHVMMMRKKDMITSSCVGRRGRVAFGACECSTTRECVPRVCGLALAKHMLNACEQGCGTSAKIMHVDAARARPSARSVRSISGHATTASIA